MWKDINYLFLAYGAPGGDDYNYDDAAPAEYAAAGADDAYGAPPAEYAAGKIAFDLFAVAIAIVLALYCFKKGLQKSKKNLIHFYFNKSNKMYETIIYLYIYIYLFIFFINGRPMFYLSLIFIKQCINLSI